MMAKMGFGEVMEVVAMLAKSQGFYGRVLEAVSCLEEREMAEFGKAIEEAGLHDAVDVVMWFES